MNWQQKIDWLVSLNLSLRSSSSVSCWHTSIYTPFVTRCRRSDGSVAVHESGSLHSGSVHFTICRYTYPQTLSRKSVLTTLNGQLMGISKLQILWVAVRFFTLICATTRGTSRFDTITSSYPLLRRGVILRDCALPWFNISKVAGSSAGCAYLGKFNILPESLLVSVSTWLMYCTTVLKVEDTLKGRVHE